MKGTTLVIFGRSFSRVREFWKLDMELGAGVGRFKKIWKDGCVDKILNVLIFTFTKI